MSDNKRCLEMGGIFFSGGNVVHLSVPGEKLYRCIFLVTGGVSERTPEDSAGHHLSCGVE